MNVAIIKYNAGNIYSVEHALKRLGIEATITDHPETIAKADKVIFPGQGEASSTMQYLKKRGLDKLILDLKQPLLGICIGMQLMCRHSEEGNTDCLGIFDVDVKRFLPQIHADKVPHMGWNNVHHSSNSLFPTPISDAFFYFIHSYYVPLCNETIATTDYIQPFSAALHKDNFYATQFHPEKSGVAGEQLLNHFLNL